MNIWSILSVLVIVISFLFILICVNPQGEGILSRLRRFLYTDLPSRLSTFSVKLLGVSRAKKIVYCSTYLFYKPNPVFQLFYLALSLGGYTIYAVKGFKFLPNPYVSSYHIYLGTLLYLVALSTFILACVASPGIINDSTHAFYLKLFPYDNLLFIEKQCRTCEFSRPARSKHCSVCDLCIAKQDHHCIWLNQCVGYRNYRWFLAFISSHSVICSYGGAVGLLIFWNIIVKDNLFSARFYDSYGNLHESSLLIVFQFIMQSHSTLVFIVTLCAVMGVVLGGFFVYHLLLISRNYSSYERMKVLDLTIAGEINENFDSQYHRGFSSNLREVIFPQLIKLKD